jgi:glycosyltransferase involved in cell wall biosynthesis
VTRRVLHVLEAVGGGTARHLLDVVRHTPGVEHHVAIPASWNGQLRDLWAAWKLRADGARVSFVQMHHAPFHPGNAAALVALRALVADLRPDIVHGHSSVGGALARLASWHAPVPRVYTPNGLRPGRASTAIERLLAVRTNRIVACSPSEAEELTRRAIAPADRIVTIPNGIDLEPPGPASLDLRRALGIDPHAPLVGTLCRLVEQKAPEWFVAGARALLARNREVHCLLIGSGPLERRVQRLVREYGLGWRFHRMPALPEAARVLDQLDVFVLVSRFEGGPYSPLEAMRAGTPVVLSDVVGNRDVVEHGVSGLLVPPGDAERFAEAVDTVLRDDLFRAKLVRAARERLVARFDARAMGAALGALYAELLEQSSSLGIPRPVGQPPWVGRGRGLRAPASDGGGDRGATGGRRAEAPGPAATASAPELAPDPAIPEALQPPRASQTEGLTDGSGGLGGTTSRGRPQAR